MSSEVIATYVNAAGTMTLQVKRTTWEGHQALVLWDKNADKQAGFLTFELTSNATQSGSSVGPQVSVDAYKILLSEEYRKAKASNILWFHLGNLAVLAWADAWAKWRNHPESGGEPLPPQITVLDPTTEIQNYWNGLGFDFAAAQTLVWEKYRLTGMDANGHFPDQVLPSGQRVPYPPIVLANIAPPSLSAGAQLVAQNSGKALTGVWILQKSVHSDEKQ
ncbi:hypothetical protein CNMCM6106_007709 [Aspergillus hiratsukae]|uniref:Uncharacterized protein n=1 Tax=Aspergillus hiratsukae TaxID=1194566 RepID=A0A8H6V051_9EURO|nr:hypothetical protein CNMCM6106_007709 [Aspergillus hiratsukae]